MEKVISNTFSAEQFEEILVYFSNSIHLKNNEDEILWDLAKNCISKLGFVDCVVYLIDYENNQLLQKAAFGPKNPKAKEIHNPIRIALGEGISGSVAKSGKAEIVADTSKDARYLEDDENRLSEICVPIKADNEILGVIDCEHPEKDYFTQQHLRILSAVASLCAFKIQNVRADLKIKTEREKLLAVREEMVQLKLKAFRSQMNPHFIFNALSGIQYFVTTSNKKQALTYLSVFSKLMRFYLQHFEKETVSLSDEISMLNNYLKLQKLRYEDQFEYSLNLEGNSSNDATIPSFILQTLFENIIEHAVYNHYKNYAVEVHFKINARQVLVNISFTHDADKTEKIAYTPNYRDQLMKWQDQVRFLNRSKNYNIQKKVTFNKSNGFNGGNILLSLPNL